MAHRRGSHIGGPHGQLARHTRSGRAHAVDRAAGAADPAAAEVVRLSFNAGGGAVVQSHRQLRGGVRPALVDEQDRGGGFFARAQPADGERTAVRRRHGGQLHRRGERARAPQAHLQRGAGARGRRGAAARGRRAVPAAAPRPRQHGGAARERHAPRRAAAALRSAATGPRARPTGTRPSEHAGSIRAAYKGGLSPMPERAHGRGGAIAGSIVAVASACAIFPAVNHDPRAANLPAR